jgi:hypothetical protein
MQNRSVDIRRFALASCMFISAKRMLLCVSPMLLDIRIVVKPLFAFS